LAPQLSAQYFVHYLAKLELPGSKTKAASCFGPKSSPFCLLFLWFLWFFLFFCFSLLLVFMFFSSSFELDHGYCGFERGSTVPLPCFLLPVLPSVHPSVSFFILPFAGVSASSLSPFPFFFSVSSFYSSLSRLCKPQEK